MIYLPYELVESHDGVPQAYLAGVFVQRIPSRMVKFILQIVNDPSRRIFSSLIWLIWPKWMEGYRGAIQLAKTTEPASAHIRQQNIEKHFRDQSIRHSTVTTTKERIHPRTHEAITASGANGNCGYERLEAPSLSDFVQCTRKFKLKVGIFEIK